MANTAGEFARQRINRTGRQRLRFGYSDFNTHNGPLFNILDIYTVKSNI